MSWLSNLLSVGGSVLGMIPGIGTVGSIIGAGASALGKGMAQDESNAAYLQATADTNAANKVIAEQNNAESWRRLQATNAFNKEMWNENNLYNSPSAQMARLRAAGLNPAAFTGESPATQISSASPPGMESIPMQAPGQTPVADYSDLTNRLMANELVKGQQIKNASDSVQLSFLTQEKQAQLAELWQRVSNFKMDHGLKAWQLRDLARSYNQNLRLEDSVVKGAALQVDSLEQNMKVQDHKMKMEQNEDRRQEAYLSIARAAHEMNLKVSEQDIRTSAALAAQASASAEGMNQENRVKKLFAEYEEALNKAAGENNAGTTQQQVTMAYLSALNRANVDAEAVNDWIRSHKELLGSAADFAFRYYENILHAGMFLIGGKGVKK